MAPRASAIVRSATRILSLTLTAVCVACEGIIFPPAEYSRCLCKQRLAVLRIQSDANLTMMSFFHWLTPARTNSTTYAHACCLVKCARGFRYDPNEVDLMGDELGDGNEEPVVELRCSTPQLRCIFRQSFISRALDTQAECCSCGFRFPAPGPQVHRITSLLLPLRGTDTLNSRWSEYLLLSRGT